jgi:Domain of unknown function (DUF4082)
VVDPGVVKRLLAVAIPLALIGSLLAGTANADPMPGVPWTPTSGSTVPVGEPVMIAGTATNGESGDVDGVDISFDGGATWLPAEFQPERYLYLHTPREPGTVNYLLRAHGSRGHGPVVGPFQFFAGGAAPPPTLGCSCVLLFPDLPHRPQIDDPEAAALELGVRVRFDRPGHLTGALIFRGTYEGPLTAHAWSADGTLLAEVVSGPGRYSDSVRFTTRVPVEAGEEFVVSYYTPVGGYRSTEDYFIANMVSGPFLVPPGAGVYAYGGGFPAQTWNNSNYWVHPLFEPAFD